MRRTYDANADGKTVLCYICVSAKLVRELKRRMIVNITKPRAARHSGKARLNNISDQVGFVPGAVAVAPCKVALTASPSQSGSPLKNDPDIWLAGTKTLPLSPCNTWFTTRDATSAGVSTGCPDLRSSGAQLPTKGVFAHIGWTMLAWIV